VDENSLVQRKFALM